MVPTLASPALWVAFAALIAALLALDLGVFHRTEHDVKPSDLVKIPILVSLAVIVVLVGGSVLASMVSNRRDVKLGRRGGATSGGA